MENGPQNMYTVDIIVRREERMANGARSDSIVRGFALSSVFWLVIGLIVGLWLAAEMIYPACGSSTPTG
jgi:cbb3-type cytochrome oxidase subunit 1